MKKLFQFSTDKQFFIKRCLYRWNTILTTVPKHLSYTRKKFILKHRSSPEKMKLRKNEIAGKSIKIVLYNYKSQSFQQRRTHVVRSQNNFLSKTQRIWNTIFSISWFLFKLILQKTNAVLTKLPKISLQTPRNSCSNLEKDKQFYLLTKSHKTALQTQSAVLTTLQKNCLKS